jgi:hypothetical protein
MSAHILPPLAVNNKSERKVNSLPPLGFELVIFGMLAYLSNHSAKSHVLVAGLRGAVAFALAICTTDTAVSTI